VTDAALRFAASGLALILLAGAGRAAETEVVARIGTIELQEGEVRSYVAGLDAREQAALARDPTLLAQAVRLLLASKLVLKEALEKKWDQQPAVAAQLEQARENAIVDSYLRSMSEPPESFPSEAELQAAYDANKTAFLVPRQFQLAQIVIGLPKNADKAVEEKARRKLEDVQKQLKQKNADFGAIAERASDEPDSAKRRGDIGWVSEAQLVPAIRSQVIGLVKGAFTEPVALDDGWHVVKLVDTKPAYTRPLGEVRDRLRAELRRDRAAADRRAYLAKLLQETPPAINELALGKIIVKPEHQP